MALNTLVAHVRPCPCFYQNNTLHILHIQNTRHPATGAVLMGAHFTLSPHPPSLSLSLSLSGALD